MGEKILLLFLYVQMCNAGVVSRNFKTVENDILLLIPDAEETDNISVPEISEQSSDEKIFANDTLENLTTELAAVDVKNISDLLNGTERSFSENTSGTATNPPTSFENASHTVVTTPENSVHINSDPDDLKHEDDGLDQSIENTFLSKDSEVETSNPHNRLEVSNSSLSKTEIDINTTTSTKDFQAIEENLAIDLDGTLLISDLSQPNDSFPKQESIFAEDGVFRSENKSAVPTLNDTELNADVEFSGDVIIFEETSKLESNSTEVVSQVPEKSDEIVNSTRANSSEGIFSTVGFDFLLNSEVVKNAAMAMEVFNPTDTSITDHIIEENEFNHFVDLIVPSLDDEHVNLSASGISVNKNQNDLNEETQNFEGSTENDHSRQNITLPFEDWNKTADFLDSSAKLDIRNETTLLDSTNASDVKNETLNPSDVIGNETRDVITIASLGENNTAWLDISTKDTVSELSADDSFENLNTTVTRKCPTPGICLFWFLARNACNADSQCLGSKICCRIRCSKVCIEV